MCIPIPQKVYNITKKDCELRKKLKNIFPDFFAFIDSTEQQIPRPVDKNKRKMYYSGKKKRHTVKNQIMVNNCGYILHKVAHKKGKRHDYDVYKNNHPLSSQNKLLLYLI